MNLLIRPCANSHSVSVKLGTTVLLTTHDMDDVETLCPRMLIVDHGRKLYDGTVANIRERFGGERTLIAVLDPAEFDTLARDGNGLPILGDLPEGVTMAGADNPKI